MSQFIRTLIASLVVCSSLPAIADEEKHSIDIETEKAMEEKPSTAGMVQALSAANDKWEAEMKKSLATLHKTMSPGEKTALEASQKQWESFREAEIKTQDEIFGKMEGTMWRPASVSASLQITKSRALQLAHYAEIISER